jgi:hypothetical protein
MPCLVAIDPDHGVTPEQVHESAAQVLFGSGIDFERWAHALRQDRVATEPWTLTGADGGRIGTLPVLADPSVGVLALVLGRGKRVEPVNDHTELRSGDTIWFAIHEDSMDAVAAGLQNAGWTRKNPAPAEAGESAAEAPEA